jgi:hypothetical protein
VMRFWLSGRRSYAELAWLVRCWPASDSSREDSQSVGQDDRRGLATSSSLSMEIDREDG